MTRRSSAFLLVTALAPLSAAWGQDPPDDIIDYEEEAAPAPIELRAVPPRFSWEAGVTLSFGQVAQLLGAPPGIGIGARGGWGKHFGDHRVGFNISLTLEGEIAVLWANVFEPAVAWDTVIGKGLYLGADLGPTLSLGVDTTPSPTQDSVRFDPGAFVGFRIGYSQPWSLVARRFWIYFEPKLRILDGQPMGLISVSLGSGRGY